VAHALLALIALRLLSMTADTSLPEGNRLVRELLARQRVREDTLNDYAYDIVELREEMDGSGRVVERKSRRYQVFHVKGRPVRRLTEEDGRALSPEKQAKENGRVDKLVLAILADRAASERPGVRLSAILERYDFHSVGRENVDGRSALVLEFVPLPGSRRLDGDNVLRRLEGRLWVDEEEGELVRVQLRNTSGIRFALGLGASVSALSVQMEFRKVGETLWFPHRVEFDVTGRKLLLKGFHRRATATYGPFRRFQVESEETLRPPLP
jgi:hypothetical protein